MAKFTNEEMIASLKEMTILELNDLVKAIEEEFGVTAAAPVAVAAAADVAEESNEVSVILVSPGGSKVPVIKVIREITGAGIVDAKAIVDNVPSPVKEGIEREEAETIKAQLEAAGATVEIK